MRLLRNALVLVELRNLDAGSREPDYVANVGSLRADDGPNCVVGDEQVRRLLELTPLLKNHKHSISINIQQTRALKLGATPLVLE